MSMIKSTVKKYEIKIENLEKELTELKNELSRNKNHNEELDKQIEELKKNRNNEQCCLSNETGKNQHQINDSDKIDYSILIKIKEYFKEAISKLEQDYNVSKSSVCYYFTEFLQFLSQTIQLEEINVYKCSLSNKLTELFNNEMNLTVDNEIVKLKEQFKKIQDKFAEQNKLMSELNKCSGFTLKYDVSKYTNENISTQQNMTQDKNCQNDVYNRSVTTVSAGGIRTASCMSVTESQKSFSFPLKLLDENSFSNNITENMQISNQPTANYCANDTGLGNSNGLNRSSTIKCDHCSNRFNDENSYLFHLKKCP